MRQDISQILSTEESNCTVFLYIKYLIGDMHGDCAFPFSGNCLSFKSISILHVTGRDLVLCLVPGIVLYQTLELSFN